MTAGTITSLETQKKSRDRVSVFIDGKYAFGISKYVFLKTGLKKGMELTETGISGILEEEALEKHWAYVLRLLTRRDYTTSEIEKKLAVRKAGPGMIGAIKDRLTGQGLTDDRAYARKYLEFRSGHGYHYLYSKLLQRGIPKDDIRKALKDFFEQNPEIRIGREFLEKSRKKWDLPGSRERMKKIAGLLKNRGFSESVIYELAGQMSRHHDGDGQADA